MILVTNNSFSKIILLNKILVIHVCGSLNWKMSGLTFQFYLLMESLQFLVPIYATYKFGQDLFSLKVTFLLPSAASSRDRGKLTMAAMVVTANCIRDSILSVATSPLPSASSVNRYSYSNCDSVRKRRQQNIQKNSNYTLKLCFY